MDSDNKFYITVWSLVSAIILAIIGACTIVSIDTKSKWEKAVANGADPMVVSCALNISGDSRAADAVICNTLAQNRK